MVSEKNIWVLEDDDNQLFVYQEIFDYKYKLTAFKDLESFSASWLSKAHECDILIADIRLPKVSFLGFLASSNQKNVSLPFPFIVVSSLDDIDVLRMAFNYGAVDYIVKPFTKTELIAKVERYLKYKSSAMLVNEISHASILIDDEAFTITNHGRKSLPLTVKEFKIFKVIFKTPQHSIDREQLTRKIWSDVTVSKKTLDVHLFNLRQKLKHIGIDIEFHPPAEFRLVDHQSQESKNVV